MQYKVISLHVSLEGIQKQLDEKGSEEWELVSIVHQPKAYKRETFSEYLAYFKKPSPKVS